MTIRYQGAPSRSGRSSTITRCYSGAWSGAQAPSATRWPAASPASDRSRSCAITWTRRSCPCRGGGTLPLPGGGHAGPCSKLVRALIHEHRKPAYLDGPLRPGVDGGEAATIAELTAALFTGHVTKVNDLLPPSLTGAGADLGALLADMHTPQAGVHA